MNVPDDHKGISLIQFNKMIALTEQLQACHVKQYKLMDKMALALLLRFTIPEVHAFGPAWQRKKRKTYPEEVILQAKRVLSGKRKLQD